MNRIAAWGMGLISVLALVGMIGSDFVPSHLTVRVAETLSVALGLFYGAFFLGFGRFGWGLHNPRVAEIMSQGGFLSKAYLRAPFMAFVFFGLSWLGLSAGLAWALNAAVGTQGSMTFTVDGWSSEYYSVRSGRSCAHPTLEGVPWGMLGRRAICVDLPESAFPAGDSLTLTGKASALGITPTRFSVHHIQ